MRPILAGAIIEVPDSPPKATLQTTLATAIKTITANPISKFRFQKAAPNIISENGTNNVIMILAGFQALVR